MKVHKDEFIKGREESIEMNTQELKAMSDEIFDIRNQVWNLSNNAALTKLERESFEAVKLRLWRVYESIESQLNNKELK